MLRLSLSVQLLIFYGVLTFAVFQREPGYANKVESQCREAINLIPTHYTPTHQLPIVFFNNGRCRILVVDVGHGPLSPQNDVWPMVHEEVNYMLERWVGSLRTWGNNLSSWLGGHDQSVKRVAISMEFADDDTPDSDGLPKVPSYARHWNFWGPNGQIQTEYYPRERASRGQRNMRQGSPRGQRNMQQGCWGIGCMRTPTIED